MAPKEKDTFANVISVCPSCKRKQLLRVIHGLDDQGQVCYTVRCCKPGCSYSKSYNDEEFAEFLATRGDVEIV